MEDNKLVKIESEDGKSYNMLILNEFDHKNKKYAVLMEMNNCGCDDDCDCEHDCDSNCDCECEHDCDCGDDCDSNCDCECEHDCDCGDDCCCSHDEPMLCILEITKDKDGNEIFKSIDDEETFNEVASCADEILSC